MRTNLTADTYRRLCPAKNCFIVEKLWLFGLFSGGKVDNIDVWMIKITIKAYQIDMDVLLISKEITYNKHVCPKGPAFSISLLVCEFFCSRTNIVPKFTARLWMERSMFIGYNFQGVRIFQLILPNHQHALFCIIFF